MTVKLTADNDDKATRDRTPACNSTLTSVFLKKKNRTPSYKPLHGIINLKTETMKTVTLMIFSLLIVSLTFAQSKKDMEQNILQHEEKIKNLESEIINIKNNLTNTTTTLGLVSKSNLDLEKLVKEQSLLIEKLIKQNDSLLIVFKVNKDVDYVTTPKNEEDSIIFLIQSYYACKKWEDRLAFVLKPETVKSSMNAFYTDNYKSKIITKEKISIQGSDYKNNESFKVVIDGFTIIYCKKTSDGFKIDWEASVGYNPISMKTFRANLSTQPTEFRVSATIGTYYNYNYRHAKNTHWNVSISDNDGNSISGCYISKSSAEGKRLYEILKDGKRHALILEIKIDATESDAGNIAIITKVIKEGWSK